jgi:hypothetical protein
MMPTREVTKSKTFGGKNYGKQEISIRGAVGRRDDIGHISSSPKRDTTRRVRS